VLADGRHTDEARPSSVTTKRADGLNGTPAPLLYRKRPSHPEEGADRTEVDSPIQE
jgi:hypothetical protein